ncbi:hypothetical protein B0T10DRAFT_405185 [Thelonectria olida]|uniref:Rab-GAP TBC domain-containing protein n=1 Tax=Thelonectria olida TaxID=1576542 RepID=A0A9P9ANS1_9HYPO|nr:hypothetical protein B0T10DRAFT_405185 [Thelonectria olida]
MKPTPITIPTGPDEPVPSPRSPNRKFSLYASRMRDDESPVPTAADAYTSPLSSPRPFQETPSLPPSPRVHIVPFGFAYRHARGPSNETLPFSQLPPLPLSPRLDSFSQGPRFIMQPTTASSGPTTPMDPPPHPPSPFAYDAYSVASAPDSRNASPTFPALASKLSLADRRASDTPAASSPSSPVENFSRPRKQSIRQPITDPVKPQSTVADQYLELVSSPTQDPLWPPNRPRGPSVSSCQSSSTYHSTVLSPPASEFREPLPRSNPNPNGAPVTSPTSHRSPLTYNTTNGPASPSAVVAPWMSGEELRSSFRSQFTESTAPGTTVTERSSVLTKDSSVTSLYPAADEDLEADGQGEIDAADNELDDDELSLDDLMGMYEKGFDDDDSDIEYHVEDHRNYNMNSRPGTSASDREPRIPFPQIHIDIDDDDDEDFPQRDKDESGKTSTLDREIRMSKLIFSSPAYIASVPHIAENLHRKSMDKRDSAKSLDSERSIASHPTALSEKAPPASSPLAETPSPISPPISPPIEEGASSLPPPVTQGAALRPISPPMSPPPPAPNAVPAQVEDPNFRDRYGFKKENQNVTRGQYDAWNAGYTEYLARRRKKWVAYLKDNALMTDQPNRFPAPNAKTKRFVRKGIPPEWRGAAWFYYAGGPAILAQHSGLYDKLTVKRAKDVDAEAIERDLHRTFPDNIKFKPPGGFKPQSSASARESQSTVSDSSIRGRSPVPPPGPEDEPPIITSLRRVLHAFAVYNPRIGYCQSLNFLAGLLLLFVETEEQCFWLLNVITRIYLPGTHETSLEGSKVDLGVLMTELRDTMPAIWDKVGGDLEAGDAGSRPATGKSIRMPRSRRKDLQRVSTDRLPPITVCMTAWFMSCFIGTLPIETTLRVWDVFFYEGSKTLFRIALAIFKTGENEIKAVSDPMEMFGVVQGIPRKMIDANALMEACFKRRNGFGHLSQDQIDVRRQERRAKVQYNKIQAQVKTNTTWTIAQSDNEGRANQKSLFGKKRAQTGV